MAQCAWPRNVKFSSRTRFTGTDVNVNVNVRRCRGSEDELSECTSVDQGCAMWQRCFFKSPEPNETCAHSRCVLGNSTRTVLTHLSRDDHRARQRHKHSHPHNARAGALMAHHPAWVGHHRGGSNSTPTVHACPLRWEGCGWLNSTIHTTISSTRYRSVLRL